MRSPKMPAEDFHRHHHNHLHPAPPVAHAGAGATGRRKGAATREWRVITATGQSYLEEIGRHSIMERTGLPARDLRVLDPLLSYPSTILGRERSIVINLEHIRAIITATEVLIPNSKEPSVELFVGHLQSRVSCANIACQFEPAETSDIDGLGKLTSSSFPSQNIAARNDPEKTRQTGLSPGLDNGKSGSVMVLPFEFRALEVCLECACRCLESETSSLEEEAYPALDELTSKVSTLNLERVRQIKSRLVAISGRVQKVRDEIEHLLDDDMDMAEMYLTEKLAHEQDSSSVTNVDNGAIEQNADGDEDFKNDADSASQESGGTKLNVEELEMLLEAYFVQIDGTLNKLSHLREYVDDTEDYINIMLDEKQNQLLQIGVMLSTATVVTTAGVVVVSLFGMNVGIDLYGDSIPTIKFWETTFGTSFGCLILYILAIWFGKKSGLLQ